MTWAEDWSPPPPHWPPAQSYGLPLPADAPAPPAILLRRRRRRSLIALGALACTAAVAIGAATWSQYADSHSPATAARHYFQALADGDAPRALAFADEVPSGEYLTSEVLEQQLKVAKLSDISVRLTNSDAHSAGVDVSYRLGFESGSRTVTDQVQLVKHGSQWRLSRVSSNVSLAQVKTGGDRVMFAGRPLTSATVTLFPGALPVATDTAAVQIIGDPSVRLNSATDVLQINVDVSEGLKKQAATAVDVALAKCLAAAARDPRCPLPDVRRPIPGSLHGTASKKLADGGALVGLSADGGGLIEIGADVPVDGNWKTWDFNNQEVAHKGSITLHLTAQASIDNLAAIEWTGPK